MQVVEVLQ
jgi:hypothetical protein